MLLAPTAGSALESGGTTPPSLPKHRPKPLTLGDLNRDVGGQILLHLDLKDRLTLAQCNHHWNFTVEDSDDYAHIARASGLPTDAQDTPFQSLARRIASSIHQREIPSLLHTAEYLYRTGVMFLGKARRIALLLQALLSQDNQREAFSQLFHRAGLLQARLHVRGLPSGADSSTVQQRLQDIAMHPTRTPDQEVEAELLHTLMAWQHRTPTLTARQISGNFTRIATEDRNPPHLIAQARVGLAAMVLQDYDDSITSEAAKQILHHVLADGTLPADLIIEAVFWLEMDAYKNATRSHEFQRCYDMLKIIANQKDTTPVIRAQALLTITGMKLNHEIDSISDERAYRMLERISAKTDLPLELRLAADFHRTHFCFSSRAPRLSTQSAFELLLEIATNERASPESRDGAEYLAAHFVLHGMCEFDVEGAYQLFDLIDQHATHDPEQRAVAQCFKAIWCCRHPLPYLTDEQAYAVMDHFISLPNMDPALVIEAQFHQAMLCAQGRIAQMTDAQMRQIIQDYLANTITPPVSQQEARLFVAQMMILGRLPGSSTETEQLLRGVAKHPAARATTCASAEFHLGELAVLRRITSLDSTAACKLLQRLLREGHLAPHLAAAANLYLGVLVLNRSTAALTDHQAMGHLARVPLDRAALPHTVANAEVAKTGFRLYGRTNLLTDQQAVGLLLQQIDNPHAANKTVAQSGIYLAEFFLQGRAVDLPKSVLIKHLTRIGKMTTVSRDQRELATWYAIRVRLSALSL